MASRRIELEGHDIIGLRAANPGLFSLSGTNTWVIGRDPTWVVDPGPDLPEHVEALAGEIQRRDGLGGIALTHDHADHRGALAALCARFPGAAVAAARGDVDVVLGDGDRFGPLLALATPGHAPDHLAFLHEDPTSAAGPVTFTGDAVLGEGSVFVAPDPGALVGYLSGLRRLRAAGPVLLCPGHGPPVTDPAAKIDEYIAHRLDRERRLRDALDAGARSVAEMLDAAWGEVALQLRPAAAVTLAAHLDKLSDEHRLPPDVQRPELPDLHGAG